MIGQKELVKYLVIDSLKRAVDYYGLEGCMEAIDRVYEKGTPLHTTMKDTFNETFLRKVL